jgi:site-specific DNA-adenine methylase
MLTQLSRLSVEADGRYARTEELQFLKNYYQSLDDRLRTYEKVRAAAEEIVAKTEAEMRNLDPQIFMGASGDYSERWRKDITNQIRYAAAAMLFNEHEYLKQGFLIWFQTIVNSYKFNKTCKLTFKVMPEVVKKSLSPEEAALFCQILSIHQIVLS